MSSLRALKEGNGSGMTLILWYRSSRNLPFAISSSSILLVATTRRTSTVRVLLSPTRRIYILLQAAQKHHLRERPPFLRRLEQFDAIHLLHLVVADDAVKVACCSLSSAASPLLTVSTEYLDSLKR